MLRASLQLCFGVGYEIYLVFLVLADFDMSDAQEEHALVVQHHEPRLAALKIELCPTHMSEGCFWKIYFLLLHSRLSKHDAELLSTRQVCGLVTRSYP